MQIQKFLFDKDVNVGKLHQHYNDQLVLLRKIRDQVVERWQIRNLWIYFTKPNIGFFITNSYKL